MLLTILLLGLLSPALLLSTTLRLFTSNLELLLPPPADLEATRAAVAAERRGLLSLSLDLSARACLAARSAAISFILWLVLRVKKMWWIFAQAVSS